MADLDLLREINNTYGHLAGDAVLKGIAKVFRSRSAPLRRPGALRRRGVLHPLPETSAEEALEIAERIRKAVARPPFEVETSSQPIRATVSIGVAAFPRDGSDANELIHQADLRSTAPSSRAATASSTPAQSRSRPTDVGARGSSRCPRRPAPSHTASLPPAPVE